MAQATLVSSGWEFEVERGPDWLFVRPRRIAAGDSAANFAEQVWALLEQQFTYRLVLEFGELDHLNSELIGQLLLLYKRIHTHDGMLRICELSDEHMAVLYACCLNSHFPRYETREDAVMGIVSRHPR